METMMTDRGDKDDAIDYGGAESGAAVAVDDTEDLPDDFVEIQKTMSNERRRCHHYSTTHGIQDALPFPFAPNIRPLTVSDLESCVALEDAAFANPAHRCSREKFVYRLSTCSELSLGVFCTVVPSDAKAKSFDIDTLSTARAVETGRDDGAVSVLMAHVIATRSHDAVVTDDAMDFPGSGHYHRRHQGEKQESSSSPSSSSSSSKGVDVVGNQESGRTLCIHSLAVHPKLQGVGMGKLIVKSYLQRVKDSELADRIALICQEYLINYYKRFGFIHAGPSKASFGGGGWHDMTFDLSHASPTS